jgi:AcrR family transcriptional regulator
MLLLKPDAMIQKQGFDTFDSRDRILLGAMELIARDGLDAASTRAIAAQSKLTIGMIWKIFGSKENLLAEIDNHTIRTIGMCFERMPAVTVDDLPQLWMSVGGALSADYLLEFAYLRRAIADNSPSAQRLLAAYHEHCRKFYGRLKSAGLVRSGVNLDDLALTTCLLGVGVLMAGALMRDIANEKLGSDKSSRSWNLSNLALFKQGVLT